MAAVDDRPAPSPPAASQPAPNTAPVPPAGRSAHEAAVAARRPIDATGVALAMTLSFVWGGTALAIRYAADTLPPVFIAGVRFGLGLVFMVPWCLLTRQRIRLEPGQWRWPLAMGFLLFIQISLFNWGIALSNASHGALLINTFVFWVAIFEHFATGNDRLTVQKSLGLLLAGVGVALVLVFDKGVGFSRTMLRGDLVLVASAVFLGGKMVLMQRATESVPSARLVLWHNLFGTVFFFSFAGLFERHLVAPADFTPEVVWSLAYMGFAVAGFCYAIQTMLLTRHPANSIAVYMFLSPVFGVLMAWLIRGEQLSGWFFAAAGLVALGIALVTIQRKRG